ncbi:MAG TPA: acetyl-CoA acetyltransferase [Thermoleophilia bacterium]|nr:acetyl-CoA acetyltransferase [Thermoleophilia bacterium]
MSRLPIDPRTPVLVGEGQLLRHPTPRDDLAALDEPVDMMAEALRQAAAGRESLLKRADAVFTVELLSWRYANAARSLADRLGAAPRRLARSAVGGNSPQLLVNEAARAIQRGELDVALIAGAEAVYTRLLVRKTQTHLPWSSMDVDAGADAPEVIGTDRPGVSDAEMARSLVMPVQVYPIFENALRAAAGRSPAAHLAFISGLWARFSEVAAANPYAWSPVARTAEEIATITPDNRMIGYPYPKLLNANIQTDQAAALILCSADAATAAGVTEDEWVFVHAGAAAHDHWFISERWSLAESPAIRLAGEAAFELAGTGPDGVAHVDLYSCFPSAVEVGAAALGFGLDDPDRPLTVTGGLAYAGGPGNNYVTHSIATLAGRLRGDPGSSGLVSALGWFTTKHAIGIYGSRPPAEGFRSAGEEVQAKVDALPRRVALADHEGPVTVESFTVMHERDNAPALGIVACLLPDGERAWGNTTDAGTMAALLEPGAIGSPATLHEGGAIDLG